jgi:hypothetical protein
LFEQTFNIEPSAVQADTLKGSLGQLTLRLQFTDQADVEAASPRGREAQKLFDSDDDDSDKKQKKKKQKKKKKKKKGFFSKSEEVPPGGLNTSGPVEALVATCMDNSKGGIMNAEVITLLREAASIVIERTNEAIKLPKSDPQIAELQQMAIVELSAKSTKKKKDSKDTSKQDKEWSDNPGQPVNARGYNKIVAGSSLNPSPPVFT